MSNKFVLVKDSKGSFSFVPQGTPVPNGVNSQSGINTSQDVSSLVRQVEAGIIRMGGNTAQVTTAVGIILGNTSDPTFSVDTRGNSLLPPGSHSLGGAGTGMAPGLIPGAPGIPGLPTLPDLNPFGSIASAIQSATDFLKFIAWLFHPRNWLRAAEFLIGSAFIIFGIWAALQARGERIEGFTTSEAAISRSGLGRVARSLGSQARESRRTQDGPRRPRPESAPHRTRREALRQRYAREENVRRRQRTHR